MVPLHQADGGAQGEDSGEEELEGGGEDEDNYGGVGHCDGDDDTESDVPDDKDHYWRQQHQHQHQQLREPVVAAPISPRPPSKPLPSPRAAAHSPPKQQQPAALAPEIAAILEENRCASD
jgi:hypothetical protein